MGILAFGRFWFGLLYLDSLSFLGSLLNDSEGCDREVVFPLLAFLLRHSTSMVPQRSSICQ